MTRVYYAAFFFSLGWEPLGTGSTWAYYGFHLYFYNGIPVAIMLGWSAWLVICYFLLDSLKRRLRLSDSFPVKSFLTFSLGTIIGFFVEVMGVGLRVVEVSSASAKELVDLRSIWTNSYNYIHRLGFNRLYTL